MTLDTQGEPPKASPYLLRGGEPSKMVEGIENKIKKNQIKNKTFQNERMKKMKKLLSMLLVISMLASVLASVLVMLPVSAAVSGTTYTEDFTSSEAVGFHTPNEPGATITDGAAVLTAGKTGKYMYLPSRSTKFNAIQADEFENAGNLIEYGYDVWISNNANRTSTQHQNYVKGILEVAADNDNVLQMISVLPEIYVNGNTAGANKVTIAAKTATDNAVAAGAQWANNSLTIPNRVTDDVNAGGETYKLKAVVRYVPATSSTAAYYETVSYLNGEQMAYVYSTSSAVYNQLALGRITAGYTNDKGALVDPTVDGRKLLIRTNFGDSSTNSTDNIKIDNAYIKVHEAPKFEKDFSDNSYVPTNASLSSNAPTVANGVLTLATSKNTSNEIKTQLLKFVPGNQFWISADDFEKPGNHLEYGYTLHVPTVESGVDKNIYGLLGFYEKGQTATCQYFSAGPQYGNYSNSYRFASWHGAATIAGGQTADALKWGGNNRVGGTRMDGAVTTAKAYEVKAIVSYVEENGTGYYDTRFFIDGIPMLATDGYPAVHRVERVKDMTTIPRTIGFDAYYRQDTTNNPMKLDNLYMRLHTAPEYVQNFDGVSESDVMTDSSGTDDVYSVADGVLKIKGISSATKMANLPKSQTFDIPVIDFEDSAKYLEVGYKLRVPKTWGNGSQVYGLLTLVGSDANDAIEEVARTPWLSADEDGIVIYSVNGTTEANKFGARNFGGEGNTAKQIAVGETKKSDITDEYIEYTVKSVVKYMEEDGKGYYQTANIVNGKILAGEYGTPSIHKVGALETAKGRSSMTLRMIAKGDATSVVELDDLYIRMVDGGEVSLSDITIDPETGKATIAYLNTTGKNQTSAQLIMAAYNDAPMLLSADLVKAQTLAPGVGSFSANVGSVTGATKYKAFYWNDSMQPLLPTVGANVSASTN